MNQLKLTIKKINSVCDFELSWSKNKSLTAQLEYPQSLIEIYKKWRIAYLKYYANLRIKVTGIVLNFSEPEQDWYRLIRESEHKFKAEFNRWLYNYQLEPIRQKVISFINTNSNNTQLLIACSDNELTRLPWETWNIGSELGIKNKVNIARTTINNYAEIKNVYRFRKPRILAIIGDDPSLDFSQDKQVIQSLAKFADIHFLEQQPNNNNSDFAQQVFDKIIAADGWDILFFIGHSDEASLGGEFYLTPDTALKTEYLRNSLSKAAKNGLQLAFFNSCSGIDIAEYLIELGLSQVVVMREPINNQVASKFLAEFVANLSAYKNVLTALNDTCKFFQQDNIQHQYPSAYLISSLYCHPDANLFRFRNQQEEYKKWLPRKNYGKCFFLILFLSLFPPLQDLFLETRLLTQYLYRQVTKQVEQTLKTPILIVQIDEASLSKANLPWNSRQEMDRRYLAKLINKISPRYPKPKVIGIDYKLWEPKSSEDDILKQAIEAGKQHNNQFVFAASTSQQKTIIPEIANPKTSLQGDINFYPGYLELLPKNDDCKTSCPFGYLLALVHSQQQNQESNFLQQLRLHPIASVSHNFAQMWFHPILDFSISPEQIYNPIPAWCLLETATNSKCQSLDNLDEPIIIVAAGGYEEADDNFPMPTSLQLTKKMPTPYLTGGEIHGYMVHHVLNRHIITPIPDFLIILLFAILAQGIVLSLHPSQRQKWLPILAVSNLIYILICWQLYISLKILIPYLLPSVLLWSYVGLSRTRTEYEQLSHIS